MSSYLKDISGICVNEKLGVINRISSFLDPEKKKIVFDVHYYGSLLIWIYLKMCLKMLNSRKPNNLVNRIHRRSLYHQRVMMQEAHSRVSTT